MVELTDADSSLHRVIKTESDSNGVPVNANNMDTEAIDEHNASLFTAFDMSVSEGNNQESESAQTTSADRRNSGTFQCKLCDRSFDKLRGLNNHTTRIHGKNPKKEAVRTPPPTRKMKQPVEADDSSKFRCPVAPKINKGTKVVKASRSVIGQKGKQKRTLKNIDSVGAAKRTKKEIERSQVNSRPPRFVLPATSVLLPLAQSPLPAFITDIAGLHGCAVNYPFRRQKAGFFGRIEINSQPRAHPIRMLRRQKMSPPNVPQQLLRNSKCHASRHRQAHRSMSVSARRTRVLSVPCPTTPRPN
jgi:hypothetical protein